MGTSHTTSTMREIIRRRRTPMKLRKGGRGGEEGRRGGGAGGEEGKGGRRSSKESHRGETIEIPAHPVPLQPILFFARRMFTCEGNLCAKQKFARRSPAIPNDGWCLHPACWQQRFFTSTMSVDLCFRQKVARGSPGCP